MGLDLRLYLVTDPGMCAARGVEETVRAAVRGGVTMVQLRDKHAPDAELVALARSLRAALAGTGVALLVNDRLEVARAAGVDGLHVGQGDLSPAKARAALGPDAILGLSVETEAHVDAVDPALVDYLGAGPVFATATKPGHAPPFGLEGLPAMVARSPVPVVAISGLDARHAGAVRAAGAAGMAVVSAICAAPDPEAAARDLRRAIDASHAGAPR